MGSDGNAKTHTVEHKNPHHCPSSSTDVLVTPDQEHKCDLGKGLWEHPVEAI